MTKDREKNMQTCYCCEERFNLDDGGISEDDGLWANDGYFVCEECRTQRVIECGDCGQIDLVDITTTINYFEEINGTLCDDCFGEYYAFCEGCGHIFGHDELDAEGCCSACSDDGDYDDESDNNFTIRKSETFEVNPYKRLVGLELEISNFGVEEARKTLTRNGFINKIIYDGSVGGCEIVTNPSNGDRLFIDVKKLSKELSNKDFEVDTKCGLHVHFDARDLSESDCRKIYLTYGLFQDKLLEIVSPSRRKNNFCKKLKDYEEVLNTSFAHHIYKVPIDEDIPECFIDDHYYGGRYYLINFCSYFRRKTIEIRLHQGTIDFRKINAWVTINNKLIEWALKTPLKRILTVKNSANTFYRIMHDKRLKKYIINRKKRLKGKFKGEPIGNIKDKLNKKIDYELVSRFFLGKYEVFLPIYATNPMEINKNRVVYMVRDLQKMLPIQKTNYQNCEYPVDYIEFKIGRYLTYLERAFVTNPKEIANMLKLQRKQLNLKTINDEIVEELVKHGVFGNLQNEFIRAYITKTYTKRIGKKGVEKICAKYNL